MRVFLTGATGLIGRPLVAALLGRGDEVRVVSRGRAGAAATLGPRAHIVEGDPAVAGPWQDAVDGCDAVVNLAGENLFARRWNDEEKRRIHDSRVLGTANVVAAMARAKARPGVLASASAVGYYGFHEDEELTEAAPPGDDFTARVCVAWEEAAERAAKEAGARVARLRIGVVLAPAGGALAQMVTPFKLFVGGPVGRGRQWFPWVHVDDVVSLFLLALDRAEARGPINAVGPEPLRMKEFCKVLGSVLGRPSWLPMPGLALRVVLGEVADILRRGQKVVPARARELGYHFKYPDARSALEAALGRPSATAAPASTAR
jgi:hypothetical protein